MTYNRRSPASRGYSLAELLVALAVFTTIIVAALMLYDRSNRTFKSGVESTNLQQNTRVAFDTLVADVRRTGYDFDRDGIPLGSNGGVANAYQQPDEQFEYVGRSALTVRGNFDYETEAAPCTVTLTDNCDNGREKLYESTSFPVVTTGNDEIVTYALVPDSQTTIPGTCDTTTNCIQFYADTAVPRASYPGTGGVDEKLVQIRGVDLCNGGCNNPPYTLYRFTLERDQSDFSSGAHIVRTPIASNIRSLQFTYYQDAAGSETLKDINNTVDVSDGQALLGNGRYMVGNPLGLVTERSVRAKINSVRVVLVGMNENVDPSYTNTAESVASVQKYRQFRLETLVNPRNAQKRGMREQDTLPPGAPQITDTCTGRCGVVYLRWNAPAVTPAYGAPDQYKIIYDVSTAPGFSLETTTFTNTFGYVYGLTPNETYKFKVVALNSYGSATSPQVTATPLNNTKPDKPTNVTATTNLNNKVTLTWKRPVQDASGSVSCGPTVLPAAEIVGYRVERTTDISGSTGWVEIADESTISTSADNVTWNDPTAVNCTDYRYRVRAVEHCILQANYNTGNDSTKGISPYSDVVAGYATANIAPQAPADLLVASGASCNAGICDAVLTWPKVTTDVNNAAITVGKYNIYRRTRGAATWGSPVGTQTVIPSGSTVSYTDPNVIIGSGEQYDYMVRAVQCNLPSGDSPVRPFPCPFPSGIVGSPLLSASAFDGDGSAATPWLVTDSVSLSVNILDASRVQRVTMRVYSGTTLIDQQQITSPFTYTHAVPTGSIYRFDVAVTESGGCVTQASRYVEGEPQQCCLVPKSNDSTIITYLPGNNYVDVTLKNVCGASLPLDSIAFTFNDQLTPGGTKFSLITFPSASGSTVSVTPPNNAGTSYTATAPNGGTNPTTAASVGTTTYKVRVTFSKTLTNPVQPLTSVIVNYRRPSDNASTACTVVP